MHLRIIELDGHKVLAPIGEDACAYINRRKVDSTLLADIKQAKSYEFLSKGHKLVRTVYQNMPEPSIKMVDGRIVNPIWDYEHLRSELTILAGAYEYYARADGSLKIEAKSWSEMGEQEFSQFYDRLIDACLKVLPDSWDHDELERVSREVLSFA